MVVVSPYQCSKQASECSMSSNRRFKSIPARSSSRINGARRRSDVAHFFLKTKAKLILGEFSPFSVQLEPQCTVFPAHAKNVPAFAGARARTALISKVGALDPSSPRPPVASPA